jgi:hypothetical protein
MSRHSKLELQQRMQACGVGSLIELVAMECNHVGMPLPVTIPWDPAVTATEAGELLALHPPHWKT